MRQELALALAAQALPLIPWFRAVNSTVPDPYLDEVFHVRQAQHYCTGRFDIWDPKITTPPGLYLLSYVFSPVFGCSITALRALGAVCLAVLLVTLCWTYTTRRGATARSLCWHSALNTTLFPPLFFFSALYYTDVASTLSVLIFQGYFLHSHRRNTSSWLRGPVLLLLGLISLLFRQTNIFWVAIFPAGVVAVRQLDKGHAVVKESMSRRVEGFGDSFVSVAKTSWKYQVIYDPPVQEARMEDYLKNLLSITVCALKTITQPTNFLSLLTALAPYLVLLASFVAFILWNGSVVLGDKSNHVATVHLPQMLYIWPYIVFFSWALTLPYLFVVPVSFLPTDLLGGLPLRPGQVLRRYRERRDILPRLWLLAAGTMVAVAVVRWNTIIHPFTLADNRHYTFYVFRLLMRRWWIRYAVTPVYIFCGWACVQAVGGPLSSTGGKAPANHDGVKATDKDNNKVKHRTTGRLTYGLPDGITSSATTSFVLIWLATASLQLITAPLVEPRYLILPWVFWRMHVPMQQRSRLWLETLWFLLINGVTGYIFLRWEFYWPQEPGKVQRFMW